MLTYIVDLTGKIPKYDYALYNALIHFPFDRYVFIAPPSEYFSKDSLNYKPLCTPFSKHFKPKSRLRQIFKGIESIFNYIILCILIIKDNVDILHLQWLPFIEKGWKLDVFVLKLLKTFRPNLNVILTIHNILPHNIQSKNTQTYIRNFQAADKLVDKYVVHTYHSRDEAVSILDINKTKIEVVHHGIFENQIPPKQAINNTLKLLMFGTQSRYKGTDIFIEAISKLPNEAKVKISAIIAGPTDTEFYNSYNKLAVNNGISWLPDRISEELLFSLIAQSDIVILPYRSISQSGVLLEAIGCEKLIIMSDLPSFVETMGGKHEDMFFETNNADSLSQLIIKCVNGTVRFEENLNIIRNLKRKYSWHNSADKTIEIYNQLINKL